MPIPILIAGQWRQSQSSGVFRAENPATTEPLPDEFPVSTWSDCDAALDAATVALENSRPHGPEPLAVFLDAYAAGIERRADELVAIAHAETGLPAAPRLKDVELPRTSNQLRLAAAAAREGSWALPTIDTKLNIRSMLAPIGPVWVFGPNNFPFAFNSIAGGDFAAAIAAGNPVIAKANTSHPGTTRLFAEIAQSAAEQTGLPAGMVQLIYRTSHDDGLRLVSDSRTGATGYTGSRAAGLALKAAADVAGKPIYLELSSINPVVLLPGAIAERADKIADEFSTSCLMGVGQFCTNPGLVLLLDGLETDKFIANVAKRFQAAPVGTLLSGRAAKSLGNSISKLQSAGAQVVAGATSGGGRGYSYANTLLRVPASKFRVNAEALQAEAFGNESLIVVADGVEELVAALDQLEGNLTGCIYSATNGEDDSIYSQIEPYLRQRVGRLLNDKMPTGVAVSTAMNHGGPYPATGHPGFTAVGIPASMRRFAALHCYDNVRPIRLPPLLRDKSPSGKAWRLIDGSWTTGNIPS
ncbi:MAG: aldehyde dehydrogenase (NADP(+)) [Pirellulales bacterium]|nr:aldehyde dehydrogenase (NADP(+)) [Pirellulales bacterium]